MFLNQIFYTGHESFLTKYTHKKKIEKLLKLAKHHSQPKKSTPNLQGFQEIGDQKTKSRSLSQKKPRQLAWLE